MGAAIQHMAYQTLASRRPRCVGKFGDYNRLDDVSLTGNANLVEVDVVHVLLDAKGTWPMMSKSLMHLLQGVVDEHLQLTKRVHVTTRHHVAGRGRPS